MGRGTGRRGIRRRQEPKTKILSEELINEILLRLPVKSLLRFKSVCKSWFFRISDPQFAISHFQLDAAHTERLFSIDCPAHEFLSIDFNASLNDDNVSRAVALKRNFHIPIPHKIGILGSCRGFLLLNCLESFYIWNPSTDDHYSIDMSPIMPTQKRYFKFYGTLRGFGYDPITDDYLVVVGCYGEFSYLSNRQIWVGYFSVRANEWKQIVASHASYRKCSSYYDNLIGCLFNNVTHWLAFREDTSMDVVIGFDLIEKSLLEIALPPNFKYNNFEHCVLRVLGEFFSLCTVEQDPSVDIWVMKEYKVQSSWTKTIVVSVENIHPQIYFLPICFTEGGDIVGEDLDTGLVKYNDRGELLEHRSYYDSQFGYSVVKYVESLLSLPYRRRERSCRRIQRKNDE